MQINNHSHTPRIAHRPTPGPCRPPSPFHPPGPCPTLSPCRPPRLCHSPSLCHFHCPCHSLSLCHSPINLRRYWPRFHHLAHFHLQTLHLWVAMLHHTVQLRVFMASHT